MKAGYNNGEMAEPKVQTHRDEARDDEDPLETVGSFSNGDDGQRGERLALIARVSQRIATRLNSEELFETTVDELYRRLGYDHVSVFLLDPAEPAFLVQHARASRWPRGEEAGYRQSIERGVLGAAARERLPQLVNDVAADPRYVPVPGAGGLRAELALPILLGERLLGVLDVAGARPFHRDDIQALQIVADQLAVAIDNAQLFFRTQRALEETRLLYATSRRISTAMDVNEVIAAYLSQVAARGRYVCTIVLYELDEQGQRTAVRVRGRWAPDEGLGLLDEQLPYTRDALDEPLDAGETIRIANVYEDPRASAELRKIQAASGRAALALIPLIAHGQRIGLVILSYPSVYEWPEADLQPYQATAAQLATAIDSRRQQSLLHSRSRQIAVLEERQRLARELHDSVTQLIFSMTLIAQSIAPAWRRDPAEGEGRVDRLLALSRSALAEMRALLAELRSDDPAQPDALSSAPSHGLRRVQEEGLAAALRRHTAEIAGDGLLVEINDADTAAVRPATVEEALYRIAQEALNNVVKHAAARHVRVTLEAGREATRLVVADDGAGFAIAQAESRRHAGLGLLSMRERAEALGGQLRLTSAPGSGTIVEVTIPVKRDS